MTGVFFNVDSAHMGVFMSWVSPGKYFRIFRRIARDDLRSHLGLSDGRFPRPGPMVVFLRVLGIHPSFLSR